MASLIYFWWWRQRGPAGSLTAKDAQEKNECPKWLPNVMVQEHLQNGWMQMLCLYMGEKQPLKQVKVQQTLFPDSSS